MVHPFLNDLTNLSESEIESKVIDLQKKYFQTNNIDLQTQIASVLDILKSEIQTRRAIEAQRQKEQIENNGEEGLDNLINVS